MKKGDVVRGTGAMGLCSAQVLGITRSGVRVKWIDGVLAGREGLVPRDMLRAPGASSTPPSQGQTLTPAPEATSEESS